LFAEFIFPAKNRLVRRLGMYIRGTESALSRLHVPYRNKPNDTSAELLIGCEERPFFPNAWGIADCTIRRAECKIWFDKGAYEHPRD
jgi:hypothetical protein